MHRLRGLLPLPVAPTVVVALLCGGAVACGGAGSGALPAVTATPTRSLPSQPQPSHSAAVTPAPTPAAPTTAPPPTVTATATATATTTARPPRVTATPTAATSSAVVVAPSAVTTSAPTSAPVSSTSDSGSSTGWWVLGIVLLAAVIGAIVWVVLVRKRKWAAWRSAAAAVARQTHVVTELLPVPPQGDPDADHWPQVREQAEHNAQDLESVAASAPSDDATRVTQGVAQALREEVSAVEALRLLETSATAPTRPQISAAEDATRRARIDLDASQARLDAVIGSQPGADRAPPDSIN